MHNPLPHAFFCEVIRSVVVPAGKPQLPQLQVDSISLVTTSALAVTEEEVVVRVTWQRNRSSLGSLCATLW